MKIKNKAERPILAAMAAAFLGAGACALAGCGDDSGSGGDDAVDAATPSDASVSTNDATADASPGDSSVAAKDAAADGSPGDSSVAAKDASPGDGAVTPSDATADASSDASVSAKDAAADAASGDGAVSPADAGEDADAAQAITANPVARKVKHVFVIVLENKNYGDTFGTSTQDPYLTGTLKPMGALLTQYYGTGHVSLDNYVSMISGQGSSLQTESDCPSFNDFQLSGLAANGQAIGTGCVYPTSIQTLPDQLKAAGYTWRGYMEDMGNDPAREPSTCGHVALNAVDVTQSPEAPSAAVANGDQYAGRHDPFIYFHSIIDSADCATNVVNLSALDADLGSVNTTPNLVFITPNLCDDGHDGDGTGAAGKGCVTGEPGGLTSSDAFLQTWVPKILASAAYQQDGLLVITFDESSTAATTASVTDAGATTITASFNGTSCCNQQIGPNVTRPSTQQFVVSPSLTYDLVTTGVGGDQVGALVISKFVAPATVSNTGYNHYALLRSIEDMFGLGYLGFAGQDGLQAFGNDVYTRPSP